MSKELIVSATRHETRVAILEDDQLVEIFHQREQEYSLAGSIHKGRVTRVLPGMQSAFVDIGLERDAFLYVSDFFEDNEEYDKIVSGVEEKVLKLDRSGVATVAPVHLATPIEPEIAAVLGAVPGAIVTAQASAEPPATELRRDNNREGKDSRGGRGRRGRRRRTGGGGLPESKFFSPREGRDNGEPRAPQESPATDDRENGVSSRVGEMHAEPANGLVVLPGESISKYVGHSTPEPEAEAFEEEAISPSALAAESIVEELDEELEEPESSAEESIEVSEEPLAEMVAEAEPFEVESTAVEVLEIRSDGVVEFSQTEVTESENDEVDATMERIRQIEAKALHLLRPDDDRAQDGAPEDAREEVSAPSDSTEAGEPESGIAEGPEPARIPQSLTATLREQGGRLPHRVSRRMRRRMRGDRPEREESSTVVENAPTEARSNENGSVAEPILEVQAPAERRPNARGPREDRGPRENRAPREERSREPREEVRPVIPSITDLLHSGQEIIVQIAKEPLGQKGARITSHIALPGRFLVYMPTVDHIGVSRKIPSDDERQRLKRILQTHRAGIAGGFIVRTAGDGRSEEELRADMLFLHNMWMDMRQKAEKKPAPMLLHHDLDLVERILRDQLTSVFKTIWVDSEIVYESVLSFVQRFQPALVSRVKLYTRPTPIFDEFGITQELEKALRPKVWLKSGGYIVINQTEALVAIDINTGKYVGKSNRLEDTIVKINTDAIKEIVRQIRLRDLGGIIVVDFIDMDERKNRQKVMQTLEECMRVDRAPYKILQFNDFGLVAITRKRVKQSLERTLCAPCPYCEGAGYVKSVSTVISEVLQEAHKIVKAVEGDSVMLRVNPEVAKVLKSNSNDHLEEIETILGKTVIIKSDPLLHQTKFDLA